MFWDTRPGKFFGIIIIVAVCAFTNSFAQSVQNDPQQLSIQQRQAQRAARVQNLLQESRQKKTEAENWAKTYGLPVRHFDGRNTFELMEIRDGQPVYYMTHNVNAAISTAANLVRDTAPYYANGYGYIVGIWDVGTVLSTHQEFGGRVNLMDSVASNYHSTHVGGTIGAAGVVASAKGMVPQVEIDSYDWDDDEAEMAEAGASYPQEPGKIYISNHSYGTAAGWVKTDWSGNYGYHWNRYTTWNGASSYEPYFGQYDSDARGFDLVAYNNPYYLIFKSAGNDRSDNPATDETVYYYKNTPPRGWMSLSYSTSVAPLGDGFVKNGYDTIVQVGVAKNVMTVGAVNDAVTLGLRDLSKATMASFSSWGPADDGRIKPDIVANGVGLYSTGNYNDVNYITLWGTSMSSPDAAGSAMLLVDYYGQLYPGQVMRSSTLKALIIHTADDLGRPGPDYSFGWGLMNTKKAADAMTEDTITEGLLNASNPDDVYEFFYASGRELRATLCWTDPCGAYTTAHDNRTPRLINDLDLRIIAPDGTTTYYPFMLDYANPSANATTGDNIRDNVEQVLLSSTSQMGLYEITVSYKGTLTNSQQYYSLIISQPSTPPEPQPPVAVDVNVSAWADVPESIILQGTDDGLPDPPATLEYIILSLPEYGDLNDPSAGFITEVPYTLLSDGNEVVYTAVPCYAGQDSFQFKVNDGGTAPSGGDSNTADVTIEVLNDPAMVIKGDFEPDCDVDFIDFDSFALAWLAEPNDAEWDSRYDISEPNDGIIDLLDLTAIADNWLAVVP